MAQFEHLPIYRQAYALLIEFHKLVPTFPKKYKFEIGSSIIKDLTDSCIFIIQINSLSSKKEKIQDLILLFEKIKLQIRVCKTLEIFSKNCYFALSKRIIDLLKQAQGWLKQCRT